MVAFQCHEQWTRTLYNALTLNRYIIAYGWINVCMGIGLRIVDDEQERLWSDNTAKRVQKTVNEGGHRRKETVVGAGLPKWTWNGSAAVATSCTVQLIGALEQLNYIRHFVCR